MLHVNAGWLAPFITILTPVHVMSSSVGPVLLEDYHLLEKL